MVVYAQNAERGASMISQQGINTLKDNLYDEYIERFCICAEYMEELEATEIARKQVVNDLLTNGFNYTKASSIVGSFRRRAREDGIMLEYGR